MQFQESDLEPLKKALLSGVRSMSIGDRTVTFNSLAEIKEVIRDIEAKIAADADPDAIPASARTIKASFNKEG
jgi:hypothetical protein